MRAVYCICKNTYSISKCACNKEKRYENSALFHGIGALVGQGESTVTNINTPSSSTSESTSLPSQGISSVNQIDTTSTSTTESTDYQL